MKVRKASWEVRRASECYERCGGQGSLNKSTGSHRERGWGVVVVVAQRRRVGSRCVSVGGVPVGVETNRSHGVRD